MPACLVKINDTYYFRLRIPKDVLRYFRRSEIVKSTHSKKYMQAKSLVRGLLGKTENLFMVLRSKSLDDSAIHKIVKEFIESTLELKYDSAEDHITSAAMQDVMQDIYTDTEKMVVAGVKARGEVNGLNVMGFSAVGADYLCEKAGYEAEEGSPLYKKLQHEVAIAKRDILVTLQERLATGNSAYDEKVRAANHLRQEERSKSHTLSDLTAAYVEAKRLVTGTGRKSKLQEKMDKITECFQYETGKTDILLSEITYDLTVKVGKRIANYPSYRETRFPGKTLKEIYVSGNVQLPGTVTVREELSRLSGLFDFALRTKEGLRANYAAKLSEVVVGKTKGKPSAAKDVFRSADIAEILRVLRVFQDKGAFAGCPHLPFITLIGLYSGARINEICQLRVTDIIKVDGLWCFNHVEEESDDKSLKNNNSIRTNPVHPTLIDLGLIRFRDAQAAKGYTGLWEGAKKISCDYYEKHGNHSHYVSKWWCGTFKSKLALSNPAKQTFHSTRHTFIDWFYQNIKPLDYEARNALSGHLDKDDLAAMELQGYDADSEAEITYTKGLNVRRQMDLLETLDYGVDLSGLRIT